jgi:hypothetical protein
VLGALATAPSAAAIKDTLAPATLAPHGARRLRRAAPSCRVNPILHRRVGRKIFVGCLLIGSPLLYSSFVRDQGLNAFGLGLSILIGVFMASSVAKGIEQKIDRLTEQNHRLTEAIIHLNHQLQHLGERAMPEFG